jgi:uncharacterized protein
MSADLDVVFLSAGVPLVGKFFMASESFDDRRPTVVVTGSWLTVKEQMPTLYAQRLVALGYNAFVFDFAGFGQSGGDLRQVEMPERKVVDIKSAHAFVRTFSFVDPDAVGHLAICASAQYTLSALAQGLNIASYASIVGWYHDAASVKPFYGDDEGVALRIGRASGAVRQFAKTGDVTLVPAAKAGDDRAGMYFPVPYYESAERGAIPEWRNEMAEMSWLYWLTYDGLSAASKVSTPTLLVHGDEAVLPDHVKLVHDNLRGPKELVWFADGGQVDWYDQKPLVDRAIAAVDPWFKKTLAKPASSAGQ